MTPQGSGPKRPTKVRRSHRDTVQWVPVTEASFARAVLAAEMDGVDLAIWLDGAIKQQLDRTQAAYRDRRYQEACELAAARMEGEPTRREWEQEQRRSFVRRPAGVSDHQAGRPSSRHDPEAGAHRPGQRRAAGPQPRGAAGA